MSLIGSGMNGLKAAGTALSTTSHNISNVNTPGFSRQRTVQGTSTPQFTGAGYIGQGANVNTIERAYNRFLDVQAREAQSQASHFDSLSRQLANVDQIFSDQSAGLSPALDDFFKSIGTVSANPADAAARQTMVSGAEVLAARFRDMSSQLDALRSGVNEQVTLSVAAVNFASTQIADLNDKISLSTGTGAQPPNDLLDRRDILLRDLAREVRVATVAGTNGAINVFLSNGQPLVLDARSFDLSVAADPTDASNLMVGLTSGTNFRAFEDATVTGGVLGGALAFRGQTLVTAQNALGRIAGALATAFNAQHATGQDRSGTMGGAFFAFDGPLSQSNAQNSGNAVLAAGITDYQAVSTSDYRINYDGTNYIVTRLSDNNQQSFASLPQTIDGFSLSLASGTPAAGDSFRIMPTRAAAAGITSLISDPARIAAALPVRSAVNSANLGDGSMRVSGVTPPAGTNLTQAVTITFTGASTFNVSGTGTGNPTGLLYTPGMTLSYNGWSAQLQGTMNAGDSFSVGANINGAGDNGNLLALARLNNEPLLGGGNLSVGEAYAQAVSDAGNQSRAASAGAKAQGAVLSQANGAQQAVSGVNLDEEAGNLLRYQQAYQAAGRVIATANTLFDEILGLMR